MGLLTCASTRINDFVAVSVPSYIFRQNPAIHQPLVQPLGSGWDADEEHDFGDFLRGTHIYRDGLGVLSSHWP